MKFDCGDFDLGVKVYASIEYRHPNPDEDELGVRLERSRLLAAATKAAEAAAVQVLCERLGYDEEKINSILDAQRQENERLREAEKEGRAARSAARQRAGL